jgi:hypothetical protein
MKPGFLLLLILATAATAAIAQTADAELRRCRAIGDAQARLACYDALPLAAAAAAPAAAPVTRAAPVAVPAPAATAAVAAAAAPAAAAPVAAPMPAAASAAPATADAASFGLPSKADEVKAITSHIPGRFEGWSRDTRIRLANGQVWQVVESGRVYYPNLENPKVTVRRAALGSFLMDIEGVAATPRVRRVE